VSERRPGGARGFTLLEAVLALALVGAALLLDLGLQAQARALEARLAAEADLLRRAEALLESVRAGVHPLRSGPALGQLAWPAAADPELEMTLVVEPTELAGLCRVAVEGRLPLERRGAPRPFARAGGSAEHDVALDTLVWQPGAPCH
jgi:hypothetical protein